MAKLPGWIKVVKTENKGATVVVVIRWWHPQLWGMIWKDGEQKLIDNGINPFTFAMRWARIKVVAKVVWTYSLKSWLVE